MLAFIGWPEVIVILVVALLLFGGKKLPDLAKSLGKGIREFKKELNKVKSDIASDDEAEKNKDDEPAGDSEDPYNHNQADKS